MQRVLLALVLCVSGVAFLSACRITEKVMPSPINLVEPRSDVRDIIIRGMQRRGWRVLSEDEGIVRAMISVREHRGVVDIHYTDVVISFEHVSSSNLHETETTIHRNYISWLNNLQRDIQDEILVKPLLPEGDGGV